MCIHFVIQTSINHVEFTKFVLMFLYEMFLQVVLIPSNIKDMAVFSDKLLFFM